MPDLSLCLGSDIITADPVMSLKWLSLCVFFAATICVWQHITHLDPRAGLLGGFLIVLFGALNGTVIYLVSSNHGGSLASIMAGGVIGAFIMLATSTTGPARRRRTTTGSSAI